MLIKGILFASSHCC